MFERFIRFAQVKRALKEARFEEAMRLLRDPLVAKDRRSGGLLARALRGILERARRRQQRGDHAPALADVQLVAACQPEFDGAATLARRIESSLRSREERARTGLDLLRLAGEQLEAGQLTAAENLCQHSTVQAADAAGQAAMKQLIQGRRRAAAAALAGAETALGAGDLARAQEGLARARSQGCDAAAEGRLADRIRERLGRQFAERLAAAGEAELAVVLRELENDAASMPGLLAERRLAMALITAADAAHSHLMDELRGVEVAGIAPRYRAIPSLLLGHGRLAPMRLAMDALAAGVEAHAQGDLEQAAGCLRLAAGDLGMPAVKEATKVVESHLKQAASALWSARALAASGKLMPARATLLEVLEKWPCYQPARRELEILNDRAQDRDERLSRARALSTSGQLKAASVILLELGVDHEQGGEARLLLKDVQARMDLVAAGLAQVRRALHGQASSSVAGLRHCLARLDELSKVQQDAEEVSDLRAALLGEIAGLESLGRLREAVAAGRIDAAAGAMAEFLGGRAQMAPRHRLDARLADLVDMVLQRAEAALAGGRLQLAGDWLRTLADVPDELTELSQRRDACGVRLREATTRAEALLDQARAAVTAGDLDRACAQLAAAREIWLDCRGAEKVAELVRRARSQHHRVQDVERLADSEDYAEAERRLRDLPPTPSFLRTRIFDIKQGLARAQGLAQGFLLRVDEGGEYLVLRSDSFTIGNVRDRWADVQVLANVAGRHARITRSMSFHGGMQDRVIAERGEVSVNGERVQDADLRPGDEVSLGSTLALHYTIPTKRSLSAILTLKGGFQVAGTDKLLLLKDRGRDGRILIGRGTDCHIRVPQDGPEIEIYGAEDGQIRVRFPGQGEMDGRPFRGEHPVTAGVVVRCGAVSMVLQPWRPASS